MSSQRVICPNLSLSISKLEPKEENNSSRSFSWCKDENVVDLYLKYNGEENSSDDKFFGSALIERNEKEELDQKNTDEKFNNDDVIVPSTVKRETNDANEITKKEINVDKEFDNDVIIVRESDNAFKKETNAATDELKYGESAPLEVNGDRKEKLNKRNIDDFDNDVKIKMESGIIKKEIYIENATTEELEVITGDRDCGGQNRFQPETVQQEEVDIKSEEEVHVKSEKDDQEKLNKKALKPKNQVVLHQCPECLYSTVRKDHLKSHSIKHKKRDEIDWFSCQECPYKTFRKDKLKRHAEIHSSLMLKCPKCSYETSRRANLNKHQNKHKTKYKSHSCPLCPYKTHNKQNLELHCRRSHSYNLNNQKMEVFKCTECPFESGCKGILKRHRLVHDRGNWFQCPDCTYKTPYSVTLKRHQMLHQGENAEGWHRCPECPYKTSQKFALQFHFMSHKTKEEFQRFKCSQCCFKTAYKQHLNWHQLKHKEAHEIEWFCCYECSFKTKHKPSLQKHIISKHKKQKQKC